MIEILLLFRSDGSCGTAGYFRCVAERRATIHRRFKAGKDYKKPCGSCCATKSRNIIRCRSCFGNSFISRATQWYLPAFAKCCSRPIAFSRATSSCSGNALRRPRCFPPVLARPRQNCSAIGLYRATGRWANRSCQSARRAAWLRNRFARCKRPHCAAGSSRRDGHYQPVPRARLLEPSRKHQTVLPVAPSDPRLRVFHTGDLGRMQQDGLFELVGRKDRQ